MKPAAFVVNNFSNLWVVDDNVCVFNIEHAKIVFSHRYDGLKIWAIKDGRAFCAMNLHDAIEFFES